MNREIRFKAWNGKSFWYNFHLTSDGTEVCETGDRYNTWDEVTLLQFTGLQDKNKNDIYEGDILACKEDSPVLVRWSQKFASFSIDKNGWAFSHWFGEAINPEDCEVIGNIFSHPELIK